MATDTTARTDLEKHLLRYRVMAYVVGVMLVLVVFVGVPLNHVWGIGGFSAVVSPIHGAFFIVYLVVAFQLALKAGFSTKGTLLVFGAGVVPLLSFWAERRITRRVRAGQPL